MIREPAKKPRPQPIEDKPVASGEEWLGRSPGQRSAAGDSGGRLWERLNPRHRKLLHMLAHALVQRQQGARLPEPARSRLATALEELERLARRIEQLLVTLTTRTPPPG